MFKSKIYINEILKKLKARLIARNFTQVFEINYKNIFALIVKFNTLQLFLVIVILKDLECYQIDINNVFTKFFLKEKIYIVSLSKVNVSLKQYLYILRSFYNLKQVVRNQYKRCIKEFIKLDFKQYDINFCLLLHFERRIMLLLYISVIVDLGFNPIELTCPILTLRSSRFSSLIG